MSFKFSLPTPRSLGTLLVTLTAASIGGGAFALAGMPAGWLSGALVATAAPALAGFRIGIPDPLRQVTFILLGTSMGSAVSPETLASMATWPLTMLTLGLSVPVMMLTMVLYLENVAGWDRRSAFFGSAPGALSAVLAMSESCGADTRRVAFAQTIRLFVLVALLPSILSGLGHQPAGTLPINPVVPDATSFALSLATGIAGALAAGWSRLPGGAMVGAMLASGVVHGAGLIEGRMPDIVLIATFVVLGANIGGRFTGTRVDTIKRFAVDGLVALIIAMAVTTVFALIGAWVADEPLTKVLLAYTPGALEVMTIMAFVLDVDPAFVAAHHLARFIGLSLFIPLVAALAFGKAAAPSRHYDIDDGETKD